MRIRSARPVLVYAARDGMRVQSFTVDVSGGGLLLAGPDTLVIGDEVTFQLTLTPGVTPVSGQGRVVRIDPQGRRAVEFDSISDLDRRRLVRFIFECQRTERRRGLERRATVADAEATLEAPEEEPGAAIEPAEPARRAEGSAGGGR